MKFEEYFYLIFPIGLMLIVFYASWSFLMGDRGEMSEKELGEKAGLFGFGILVSILLAFVFLESVGFFGMVADLIESILDNILALIIIGLLGAIAFYLGKLSKK